MASPVVTRILFATIPAADPGYRITAPLLMSEVDDLPSGSRRERDPAALLAHVKSLRAARRPVRWQEGSDTYSVVVDDFLWLPASQTTDRKAWNGTCIVDMKEI